MRVRNPQKIVPDERPHLWKDLRRELRVFCRFADILAPIPAYNESGQFGLPRHKTAIVRDQPAARFECSAGEFEQTNGVIVVQRVQHARGQHEIKGGRFLVNRGQADIAAKKPSPAAESLLRRFHVFGINIKTEVIYGWQVFQNVPWPAADVQDLLPGYGPDVFGRLDAVTVTQHDRTKQSINSRQGQEKIKSVAWLHKSLA